MSNLRRESSQEQVLQPNLYHDLFTNPRDIRADYRLSSAFAGRIGGNQRFTISRDDPLFDQIKKDVPDATTDGTWKELCDLRGLGKKDIWKSGIIEFWATLFNTLISGAAGISIAKYGTQYNLSPITMAAAGGLSILFSLPLFIHAAGPASGGHINSLITIATFTAKLAALPRAIVYVFMQCLGAVAGGFLLRAGLGEADTVGAVVPGCYWAPNTGITNGQAWVIEFSACCTVLFIAFGVGLDPRQRDIFGPALGPILIGVIVGITEFITGIMKQGYTGASMNPSRCLGLVAATQTFRGHWVTWSAGIAAACINGLFYVLIPPYHAEQARDEERGNRKQI